jgi:hypothetical protein
VSTIPIIPPRFEGFKKFPLYSFLTWNNLDEVKLHRNRTTFKIELKRKLHWGKPGLAILCLSMFFNLQPEFLLPMVAARIRAPKLPNSLF